MCWWDMRANMHFWTMCRTQVLQTTRHVDKDRFSTGLTNTFTGKLYVVSLYVYNLTRQRWNYVFINHSWFSWNTDSLIYAYNASVIRLLNISPMIKHMPHISERSWSFFLNNLPIELNKNVNRTILPVYLQGCRHATQHVPQKRLPSSL